MIYRNTRTGRQIETASIISGGNWQAVEPAGKSVKKKSSVEKRREKNGSP